MSLGTYYEGGLREVDFAGAPQPSRKTINRWVEEKTRDKIKDLLGPDDITVDTRLVLTNAIYFKGSWARKFEARATRTSPFWLSDDRKVDAPMMAQEGTFRYLAQDLIEVVELPYAGNQVSMVIVFPRKGVNLGRVEGMLTPENLRQWLSRMPEKKMEVIIPKFKLESSFLLNRALASLGMPDAFTQQADFSGMTGQKDLLISAAIHKAFVEVNEEGTEAAAATAIVMGTKAVMDAPPRFVADRPFIFAIVDKTTSSVLFLGRLDEPQDLRR